MSPNNITAITDSLKQAYDVQPYQPSFQPIAELVQTILSQNTSDLNSRPAFRALTAKFNNWEELLNARINDIAEPISAGGLAQIKAQRIQQALRLIKERRGKLDLNFLTDLPVTEAREWLKQLPGVGNKTANCVLLFAIGKPALPVDTHIFRVSKRLGLVPEKATLDDAHRILETAVMPDSQSVFEFHVLMIEHGRRTCGAQRPHCTQCILKSQCPGSQKYLQTQPGGKADHV
jgi:endonuclease-3